MTDALRDLIGCDADYELVQDIARRAAEESWLRRNDQRVNPRKLRVYDVNILLRLLDRIAQERALDG
jgi:hypothetical protein